jgi:hypothetical protein
VSAELPDFDPEEAQRRQDAAAAELPALLAASRAEGADVAERRAFWSATLHLPHWIFIARGESANPSPFVVYAGPQGDIPTVLVFSSAESALAVGRSAGLTAEEASLLLAVPLPQAIDWVASLAAAGVSMAQFEAQDEGGLVIPVHLLPAMRDDLLGPVAAGDAVEEAEAGEAEAPQS